MNNIGLFEFTEESRLKLNKLAEILNEAPEVFVRKALFYISARTFNETLKNQEQKKLDEFKKYVNNPEALQAYYRTLIPETEIREAYTSSHNIYIDKFLEECGGNYSDEVIVKVKEQKF